jgi:mono/diheme cytochrome c family protein
MVATTAFVLGFVLLGLAVVFVAMRGGARGAREAMHSQSPGGSRAATAAIALVAILFGIGVPVVVGVANGEDRKKDGPGGVQLSDAQVEGRALFAKNCGTCHTLKGAGTSGRVGPNLDQLRPPEKLVLNAIEVGRAQGQGQMPAELLTGPEAKNVASFVAAVAGR